MHFGKFIVLNREHDDGQSFMVIYFNRKLT